MSLACISGMRWITSDCGAQLMSHKRTSGESGVVLLRDGRLTSSWSPLPTSACHAFSFPPRSCHCTRTVNSGCAGLRILPDLTVFFRAKIFIFFSFNTRFGTHHP
jgi:hypothetical protein